MTAAAPILEPLDRMRYEAIAARVAHARLLLGRAHSAAAMEDSKEVHVELGKAGLAISAALEIALRLGDPEPDDG